MTSLLPIAVLAVLVSSAAYAGNEKKVTVCHIPPDDPTDAHTITVGESAVSSHLRHGDEPGECPTGCRANASVCDDGNACTSDSCDAAGQCAHDPVSCDDGNPCTTDLCDAGAGCTPVPADGASCDDGNACTSGDACAAVACQGSPIPGCCGTDAECDDDNACTGDACLGGACANEVKDCAVDDRCSVGFCDASGSCGVTPVSCDDSDFCTDDSCNPATGCTHDPTTTTPEAVEGSCPDNVDDCAASGAAAACRRDAATCRDGLDNDCDGTVDAGDSDCWFCGDGVLQQGVSTAGSCVLDDAGQRTTEQCDDGNEFGSDDCDVANGCLIVINDPI